MKRLLPLALLAVLTACVPGMIDPARPWGNQQVERVLQKGNCTVYGLVGDPQTIWVVCPPGGQMDVDQGQP